MVPENAPNTLTHQQKWVISALTTTGTSLLLSDTMNQNLSQGTTATIPFSVVHSGLPSDGLTVAATSSNPSLLPNASLLISGRGANRILSATSNPAQTGATTITLTASDGVNVFSNAFQLTVTPFNVVTSGSGGWINNSNIWGVALPTLGDTSTWRTGPNTIDMTGTNMDTFYGGTFEVQAGGAFAPGVPTDNLALNNLILSGGTITITNNAGLILDLNGQSFTLNSGTLKAGGSSNTRDVSIQNAVLAGSGTIYITGTDATGSDVEFNGPMSTLGFTGVFNVYNYGILRLPDIAPEDASFGVNLSGNGQYVNDSKVALKSLVINGTAIQPGVYTYASFTPAQQAFLQNNGGTITIGSLPTISSISPQTVPLNSGTGPIPFSISASNLTVTVISSNTNLVPPSSIVLGGSGLNRSITITPTPMQTGYSNIKLTVTDGIFTASTGFVLTVDEVPYGRFAFFFNQDGNPEGWVAGGNEYLPSATVCGGNLLGSIYGGDPQLIRTGINVVGSSMPYVLVRMQSSAGGNGQLFWGNEAGGFSATRSQTFAVPAGTNYNWYALILGTNSNWSGHAINSIRLDPPGSSGTVAVDAIIGSDGDFDKDGVDDAWEVVNHLDPTIASDALLVTNGISYLAAYTIGTNVAPHLLATVISGLNYTLKFVTIQASGLGYTGQNRYYDVQTTTDLASPLSWTGLSGYTGILGSGQTVSMPLPFTTGSHFYRLSIRLQ